MAKNKNRDRRTANASPNRNAPAPRLHVSPSPKTPAADAMLARPAPRKPEPTIADGRVFHPLGKGRPALTVSHTPVKTLRVLDRPRTFKGLAPKSIKVGKAAAKRQHQFQVNRFGPVHVSQTKAAVAFQAPHRVLICLKRKIRKEVFHALGKAGRGVRRPKFNRHSHIKC